MSAESGIPTLRDTNGLWRNYRVEEVASPDAWRRDPQLVWDFYGMRRTVAATAQPNPGIERSAALEARSGLSSLSLHAERRQFARAGRLSSAPHARRVVQEPVQERCRVPFEDTNIYHEIPLCTCGGKIRPHICWFGETPFGMDRVLRTLEVCTVFIAIGTSGMVEPAASFVGQTKARTFYVGPEEPLNLAFFDETFTGKAGDLATFDVGVGQPTYFRRAARDDHRTQRTSRVSRRARRTSSFDEQTDIPAEARNAVSKRR